MTLRLAGEGEYQTQDHANSHATGQADPLASSDIGAAASTHTHAASDVSSGTLLHERGGLDADVSAGDGFVEIKGGATTVIKSNLAATAAPGVTDDTNAGYAVGSRWIDTTNDKEYICLDASVGAAVWTETTQGGGGGAPTDADYLVRTAHGSLSSEIVVGTSPGGELGGTWASPTVDSVHSGSAHHTQSHDHSSAGDGTTLTPATLNIPNAVTPSQTAEGQAVWDSDGDVLTIGDAVGRKTLVDTDTAQTLTSKTLTTPTIAATGWTNANHAHAAANSGGTLAASAITSGTLVHERGGLEADVSAGDGFVEIKGGATTVIKSNLAATAAPGATDDTNAGYAVGSRWIDTTNDKEYVCLDASAGAAVWTETTQGGGGGGATKEFFVSANAGGDANLGFFHAVTRTSTQAVNFNFFMPHDFTSLTSAVVVMIPDATETIQADHRLQSGAAGEAYNTINNTTADQTLAVTLNQLTEMDVSGPFTGVVANDYIGFKFESDTADLRVIGLRIKYS